MSKKKDNENERYVTSIDEKRIIEVLQYAYKKGEEALNYTPNQLIKEMVHKLK